MFDNAFLYDHFFNFSGVYETEKGLAMLSLKHERCLDEHIS